MPYILPKKREPYDAIIEGILLKCTMGMYDALTDERDRLIKPLKVPDDFNQDGHFNYLITKLFMRLHWVESNMGYFDTMGSPVAKVLEELLFAIMIEVYYPPKYYRYNRAIGMLFCCKKEFNRIWKEEATSVETFLDNLAKRFYDQIVAPYEDKKRDENGTVTC